MVGTGPKGEESIIARVSLVNAYGVCLYDEFVKPREKITDFRTKVSGIRPSDLKKGKVYGSFNSKYICTLTKKHSHICSFFISCW